MYIYALFLANIPLVVYRACDTIPTKWSYTGSL